MQLKGRTFNNNYLQFDLTECYQECPIIKRKCRFHSKFLSFSFRALVLLLLSPILTRIGYGLKLNDAVIITWSGLRGAIGLTLALKTALEQPAYGNKVVRIDYISFYAYEVLIFCGLASWFLLPRDICFFTKRSMITTMHMDYTHMRVIKAVGPGFCATN